MKTFTVNLPSIKVFVDNKFLTDGKQEGFSEAYLVSVTSIPSRPLFFTVHLETGALWSRLPIWAIRCNRYDTEIEMKPSELTPEQTQPFSCLEGDIQCVVYDHLRHYRVNVNIDSKIHSGFYLFTVDVAGQGLGEDPEQHKTHNVIVLDNGELVAYPNNMCLFLDEYFTSSKEFPKYRRTNKFYLAGG